MRLRPSRAVLAPAAVLILPMVLAVAPMPRSTGPTATAGPIIGNSDALYEACGNRVWPDPQAFGPSPVNAPGE